MSASTRSLAIRFGVAFAVSAFSLVFVNPNGSGNGTGELIALGYLLGSIFAHATLAAAWGVFGPGWWPIRIPLSLLWIGSITLALALNVARNGGPNDVAATIGAALLAQWLFLQIPLWLLVWGGRLRLRPAVEATSAAGETRLRFDIRHLLIVMSITAVLLAIGRTVAPYLATIQAELGIFLYLAGTTIVTALPLLLAMLLQSRAALGVLGALALMAVATAYEGPLMNSLGLRNGPKIEHFVAINVGSAAVLIAFAAVVRSAGYVFCRIVRAEAAELI